MSDKKQETLSTDRIGTLAMIFDSQAKTAGNPALANRYSDAASALRELHSLRFKVIDLQSELEHEKDVNHALSKALEDAEDEVDELDAQLHGESELDEDDNVEVVDTRDLFQ